MLNSIRLENDYFNNKYNEKINILYYLTFIFILHKNSKYD